jgi:flotillin
MKNDGFLLFTAPYLHITLLLLIVVLILLLLYIRPTAQRAYLRTGFGGEKVIFQHGSFIFPGLHQLTEVALNTHAFDFPLTKNKGLLTSDNRKIDVLVRVLLRVAPEKRAIALAARSLGAKTYHGDQLWELFDEVLESSIRRTFITYTLNEAQKLRSEIEHEIYLIADSVFQKNGLEVVLISLSNIQPTSKDYLDTENLIDAKALQLLEKSYAESSLALQKQKMSQEIDHFQLEQKRLSEHLKHTRKKLEKEAKARRDLVEMDLANQLALQALHQDACNVDEQLKSRNQ